MVRTAKSAPYLGNVGFNEARAAKSCPHVPRLCEHYFPSMRALSCILLIDAATPVVA